MQKVLICGAYFADRPNYLESIVLGFAGSKRYDVTQRWVSLRGESNNPVVKNVTVGQRARFMPKFQLMNELIEAANIDEYDYILIADDDILLSDGFLDGYLALQERLGFALAQPARTIGSSLSHRIVRQQEGVIARETLFVEIGPLFSMHRSAFAHLLPFDLTSPMGWGYEGVWAWRLHRHGLKLGIVDAFTVDHSLRPIASTYNEAVAESERAALLENEPHYEVADCYQVLEVVQATGQPLRDRSASPRISVVLAPSPGGTALRRTFESLVRQELPREQFEVIVADGNSNSDTRSLCVEFAPHLALQYFHVAQAGTAARKNLGIFTARAPVVLFLAPGAIVDHGLLAGHLRVYDESRTQATVVIEVAESDGNAQDSNVGAGTEPGELRIENPGGYRTFACEIDRDHARQSGIALSYSVSRSHLVTEEVFDPQWTSGEEDVALIERLDRKGVSILMISEAGAVLAPSSTRTGRAPDRAYPLRSPLLLWQRRLRRAKIYYETYGAAAVVARALKPWKWC